MHQAGSDSMLTVQTFFAMFNYMQKEKDKAEYREIFDEFNHDVYGFNNDQAYRNLTASYSEPIKQRAEPEPPQFEHANFVEYNQFDSN